MAIRAEGELVLRSLRACVGALEAQDVELADEVIAFDDEIDRSYSALQEGVHAILARQTPVAGDLRLVLAMLHINLHLERMGDYCVTIAKLTKLAHGLASDRALVEGIDEMGSRAEEMIRVALDSFSARDLAGAERLVELDELIDRANRRVVGEILRLGTDESAREWGLRMLLVSRCLERVGDHATNIAEDAVYAAAAEDIRHQPFVDTPR